MLYPLTFKPIFKERVWGGRNIERLYDKPLPPEVPIGESWEITDRPEGVSVVANGPLAGRDLRWLMENRAAELLGAACPQNGRFPLLVKILDAQQKLSVQVHPPAGVAEELGGEPKSEMWHVAHAAPDADIYVGLKKGVTRDEFEEGILEGSVAACLHRIPTAGGDSIYLPSGRLHAIGAGNVIFEIQQNSDTTYRVFDWNRVGLDGQPRQLHVDQAMKSIDFDDFEPSLSDEVPQRGPLFSSTLLTSNEHFEVERIECVKDGRIPCESDRMWIIAVLEKQVRIVAESAPAPLTPGQFAIIPASLESFELEADRGAAFLQVNLGDDPPAEELKRELDAAFHPAENEIAEDPIGC